MCQYCYNEADHEGHQVTVSISQQDCGGVCDCGDPEAWVKQFPCKYHLLENYSNESLPEDLHDAIAQAVSTVLDYAIDVFSEAHTVIQRFRTSAEVRANEARSKLSEEVYGASDDETDNKYVLSLWNDQKHSFLDAITTIERGTKKNRRFSQMVTKKIDANGRGFVHITDNLDHLMSMKKNMESSGLVNTVRSCKDAYREEMCSVIFEWISDLSTSPVNENYLVLRDIISKTLCDPWNTGLKVYRDADYDIPADQEFVNAREMDLRGALDGKFIPDPVNFFQKNKNRMDLDDEDYLDDIDDDDDEDEDYDEGEGERDEEGAAAAQAAQGGGGGAGGIAGLDDDQDITAGGGGATTHDGIAAIRAIAAAAAAAETGGGDITANDQALAAIQRFAMNPEAQEVAAFLGYRSNSSRSSNPNRSRMKRQKLVQQKEAPEFWTNQSSSWLGKGKREKTEPRVQYLIFFDIRLWKNLRLLLRDMYISVLVSNQNYKLQLGRLYAEIYTQLAELYILADREPECSIISSLSTQLFTTPTIATDLVGYDYPGRILAGIYTFVTTQHIGPPQAVNPEASLPQETRLLRNRRFSQLFHDMEYILNRNSEKNLVCMNSDRIAQVTDVLILFQGQVPMERKNDTHVEYESEGWISLFNVMPYVHQLGLNFGTGVENSDVASHCLQVITPMLARWVYDCYGKRNNNSEVKAPPEFRPVNCEIPLMHVVNEMETVSGSILKCNVASSLISLHHPVHTFISWVIECGKFETAQKLRDALIPDCDYTGVSTDSQILCALLDHPLRVLVLIAQIQSGIWVRNGLSVRSQMLHYRDLTLRDWAFRRDLLLVQTLLVVVDPAVAFMTIADRWDVQVLPVEDKTDPNHDDSKRLYMIEEFLHFLIGLLMERNQLMGLGTEDVKKKYIQKEIIQCLAFGALTFSDICRTVPDHLTVDASFEDVLKEMTVFQPPRGVNDYGKYQLKPGYFERFDIHYIHFSSTRIGEAEKAYIDYYKKLAGSDKTGKPIVPEPYVEKIESGAFSNLSAFTRTVPFIKLMRDICTAILDNANKSHRDVILNNILHLFHIAALDDFNCNDGPSFADLMAREMFVKQNGEPYSVLTMLCHLVNEDRFDELTTAKILRILAILREKRPELDEYLKDKLIEPKIGEIPDAETEQERRKRIGQEKRNQAMLNMKQAQMQFAENNDLNNTDDDENALDDDDEEGGSGAAAETHECILCRMHHEDEVYGSIGYTFVSNAWRNVPFNDKKWVYEAYGGSADLDHPHSIQDIDQSGSEGWKRYREEFHEAHKIGPGFPNLWTERRPVYVSCGHGLHYSCFIDYVKNNQMRANQLTRNYPEDASQGEFLCPLCNCLCNVFIPNLWKQNTRKLDTVLEPKLSFLDHSNRLRVIEDHKFYSTEYPHEMHTEELMSSGAELMKPVYRAVLNKKYPHLGMEPGGLLDERVVHNIGPQFVKSLHQAINRLYVPWHPDVRDELADDTVSSPMMGHDDELDINFISIVSTLANSISSLEIALRGSQHEDPFGGGLLLGQLKGRTLKSIQQFTEFCKSVIGIIYTGLLDKEDQTIGIDIGKYMSPFNLGSIKFENFVRNALFMAPAADVDTVHLLKTYYIGSVCRFLSQMVLDIVQDADWTNDPVLLELPVVDGIDESTLNAMLTVVDHIQTCVQTSTGKHINAINWTSPAFQKVAYTMLFKTVNPFLRKCAIFLNVLCGDSYDEKEWLDREMDEEMDELTEMEKLCIFMRIPSLSSLLKEMAQSETPENEWCSHFVKTGMETWLQENTFSNSPVEYPGIVRLLKLPKRLDEFFNLANHTVENNVLTELPPEPAVCLFCGLSVATQRVMFTGDPRGECHRHSQICGFGTGIFLMPKRSSILLLRGVQGSFIESPYLDSHGEADETLRRGTPQYLQQNRYDHFTKTVWLMHELPNVIARRLEATTDIGGWETL